MTAAAELPPFADDDSAGGFRLPRVQEGARPQHLIVTLFGDYWFGRHEHLPSAGLVALAEEFEISSTSARAALSRLGRRGLLTTTKVGRRTFYGPTARTEGVMSRARDRIFSFGAERDRAWDGSWLIVAFSVPEDMRDVRHSLRKRLRWLGFAPLYDGVWVSARAVADEVETAIRDCGAEQASVFRSQAVFSTSDPGPAFHPLSAWDLDAVRDVYEQFVDRFGPVRDRASRGTIGASEALVERTAIMDTWRSFPNLDPELPAEVLPATWPRERAQEIFAGVYDGLGPLAEARFTQILSRYSPELAARARHYTSASVRAGLAAGTAAGGVPVPAGT